MACSLLERLVVLLLAVCCVFGCEVGWTSHGNRCLKVLGSVATFQAAQQACLIAASSPLLSRPVQLDSDADLASIVSTLSLSTAQSYWVDAHFALRGRRATWRTGQAIELTNTAFKNDFSAASECLQLAHSGSWFLSNSVCESDTHLPICSYYSFQGTAQDSTTGDNVVLVASEQALTFANAEAWCHQQGLSLVEDSRLAGEYCDTSTIWLGASSVALGASFTWRMSSGSGAGAAEPVSAAAAPTGLGQCLQLDRSTDTVSNVACTGTNAVVCSGSRERWLEPPACPPGWTLLDGYCVRYDPQDVSYMDAARSCEALDALLYSPGLSSAVDDWVRQSVLAPSSSQAAPAVHTSVDPVSSRDVYTGIIWSGSFVSAPGGSDRLSAAVLVAGAVQLDPFSDALTAAGVGTVCQRTAGRGAVFFEHIACPRGWIPVGDSCVLGLSAAFSGAAPGLSDGEIASMCQGAGGSKALRISDTTGGIIELSDPVVATTVHPLAAVVAPAVAVDNRLCVLDTSSACGAGFEHWRGQCYQIPAGTITVDTLGDAAAACTAADGGHLALPSSSALWDLLAGSAEWPAVAGLVVIGEASATVSAETVVMPIGPEQWEEEPARAAASGIGSSAVTIATVSSAEWGSTRRVLHVDLVGAASVTARPVCAYPALHFQPQAGSCTGGEKAAQPYGCTERGIYPAGAPIAGAGIVQANCVSRFRAVGSPHQTLDVDNWKAFLSLVPSAPATRPSGVALATHAEWLPKTHKPDVQTYSGRPSGLQSVFSAPAADPECGLVTGASAEGIPLVSQDACFPAATSTETILCVEPYINPCPPPYLYVRLFGSEGLGVTGDRCVATSDMLGLADAVFSTAQAQCAAQYPGLNSALFSGDSSFESLWSVGLNAHASDFLWADSSLGFLDPQLGMGDWEENFHDYNFPSSDCPYFRAGVRGVGYAHDYLNSMGACATASRFACEMEVPAGHFTGAVSRLVATGQQPTPVPTWLPATHPYTQGYAAPNPACAAVTPTPSPAAAVSSSPTASGTPTGSPTGTPSSTGTATPSETPSSTGTATPSGTPSSTGTATPSETPSSTGTATPSGTPSGTASITGTPSTSATHTATPSVSASVPTPSTTPSSSASPSVSATVSGTPAKPSQTPSPSAAVRGGTGESATVTADLESEPALYRAMKLELLDPLVAAQLEGWLLLRMSDFALSGSQSGEAPSLSVQLASALTQDILDGTVQQRDAIAVWFVDHPQFSNVATASFRLSWPYAFRRRLQRARSLDETLPDHVPPIPSGSRSPILGDILVSALLEPPSEGALPFAEGLEATLAGVSTTVLLKQQPLDVCEGDPGALQRGFCVRDGEIIRLNRGNGTESDVSLPELEAEVEEAERKTHPPTETKIPVETDDKLVPYLLTAVGAAFVIAAACLARQRCKNAKLQEELRALENPEPPKEKPEENPAPAANGAENGGEGGSEPEAEGDSAQASSRQSASHGSPRRSTNEQRSRIQQAHMIDDSTGFTALQITPHERPRDVTHVGARPRAHSSDAAPLIDSSDAHVATRATSTDMSVVSLHSSVSGSRRTKLKPITAGGRGKRGEQYRIQPQQTIDFDDAVGAVFIADTTSASEGAPASHAGGSAPSSGPSSPAQGIQAPFAAERATQRPAVGVRFAPASLAPPFTDNSSRGTDSPALRTRAPAPLRSTSAATDQDAVRLGSSGDSTVASLGSRPFPSSEVYGGAAFRVGSARSRSGETRQQKRNTSNNAAHVSLRYLVRRQVEGKTDADGSTQSGGTTEPEVWSVGDNVSVAMHSRRVSNGTHDISSGR